MSSILINALLTSAPNYDILFNRLSWPNDAWPEKERIEALTAFIEGIGQHLSSASVDEVPFECTKRQLIVTKIESVVWDQCVPFLFKISKENVPGKSFASQDARSRQSTAAACRLLGACIPHCGDGVVRRLADTVLPALREDDAEGSLLNVEVAIEVIAVLLPSIILDEQLTQTTLSSALRCVRTLSEAVVSKVTVRLLLTLLNSCETGIRLSSVLQFTLDELFDWHQTDDSAAVTERTLLCLTALSDHLFPPADLHAQRQSLSVRAGQPDPRLSRQFWRIVQAGLTHKDNVCRKRALYLLKRCVAFSDDQEAECPTCPSDEDELLFRWSPKDSQLLREFWEDYALVMETLEENQIHVVRPVLNRIDVLIQTTATDKASGGACFHPSWLLCVYQRMFHSENKSLMREGVYHLLDLQALRQPAFASAFSQFIVGPFVDVLSESSLFHRAAGQSIGDCPELGAKLTAFLTAFFSSLPLEARGSVLLQLIQRLGSRHWCAVPILFLSQALSFLPRGPLLDSQGLHALREVLRCTMITHQVLLRGASQCYLLHSALCLTQVSAVTLDDIFSFLTHFRAEESLCRGTPLWKQVTAWLSDNEGNFKLGVENGAQTTKGSIKAHVQSEMHSFLQVPASTGQSERLPDPKEADKLARAVLLCVDAEQGRAGVAEELLSPLLDTLGRLSTNAYLPLRKTDKSLQLALRLFQLGGAPGRPDGGTEPAEDTLLALKNLVLNVVDSVQEFILRRLCSELQELADVARAELYLCVLRQLVLLYGPMPQYSSTMHRAYFPKLVQVSLDVLMDSTPQVPSVAGQVGRAVAMASLATTCDLLERQAADPRPETAAALASLQSYFFSPASCAARGEPLSLGNINQTLLKPASGLSDAGTQAPALQDWGRTAAHFIRDQWACVGFLARHAGSGGPGRTAALSEQSLAATLGRGVDALSLLPSDLVLPVLAFMRTALAQVALCEEDLCVQAVTLGWELVQGLSSNPHDFWPALRGFVEAAFHRSLLELEEQRAPKLTATLKQIAAELMALSQSKTGVFNVLMEHCCHHWRPAGRHGDEAAAASALRYIHVLTEACVYGPVYRRDQRLVQEVQIYVEQAGGDCTANLVVPGDNRDDQMPRVCVLALFSHLDPSNPLHQRLLEGVVTQLMEKDKDISKSKVRYYSNSLQHRVKNRVWQTLLLLLPKLRESKEQKWVLYSGVLQEFVAHLLGEVFAAGFSSNQASVKYLIEWTMIVILLRYPEHMDRFWSCFSMDHEKTKSSICTFLSVVVHLDVIMPKLKDKGAQWRRALDVILQWCFSHNFSVRLYALLALKRVWGLAEARAEAEAACDGLGGLSAVVEACLSQAEAMQSTGNANKNWSRIQEHFFFGAFHPTRDYSVETILHTLPSLSELSDDEWIPAWKCEKLAVFSVRSTPPLRNPAPDLGLLQPGDWIQQDKGEQDREERWAEVQKKITPWRLGVQEQEPELQPAPQQRAARLGKFHGALLVVASLIDKPTNLGGLCRTCEIFGASALVLDSLRHVTDKHFQSLSVSSELWLPLLEVKPVELTDFLQLKKSEGYCIVGVEQTANSQSLQDYQFPEKTLLLLGNEREGIPANLLQLLDVCVEIPQQGVIRSLNVHVSAALLVWEYTRQHLHPR